MKDVIELLKEMGATNVVFHEYQGDCESDYLTFEYAGKEAEICAVWCNTEQAALDGSVESTTPTPPTPST